MKRTQFFVFFTFLFAVAVSANAQGQPPRPGRNETQILWDTWGVPHVFAREESEAFRAFGWAQMHSHGNLLVQLLAQGRGRGAEFYGPQLLAADRAVRIMGIPALARKWYAAQSPRFRKDIDAFAAGINQYAKDHPEKLDAAAKAVLPVDGVDILAHTTRVLYAFLSLSSGCVTTLPPGSMFGSNGWAVGPPHSATGNAMLLANPHLPWGGEMYFYEAQISAPGYEAYGTALLGYPVLVIAFNENHGWTHTVNTIDFCDLYELTRDGDGYRFDGGKRAFTTESQQIKIRQSDGSMKEEKLELRNAIQGPVVEKDGKLLAMRISGLQAGSFAGALEQWWDMGRARSLAEFQSVLARLQIPMFNVVYADRDKHIELLYGGMVPVRSRGDAPFWRGIVPGDSSALVWNKFHPMKDLPQAVDPPSGWVQNSNSAPWYMTEPFLDPSRFPAYLSPGWKDPLGALSQREQRGLRMLTQVDKLSFEQMLADKYSTHSELADQVLDDLLAAANQSADPAARQAATVLGKWDRETNADSRGALLFYEWVQRMHAKTQGDFFAAGFDPSKPLETPRGLKDTATAVSVLLEAKAAIEQHGWAIDAPWGELRRFHRGKFDLPGNGGSDYPWVLRGLGVFRNIAFAPAADGHYDANGGDSFVAAVEFSKPLKARVLMTYGNTSDPSSPHFGDQLPLTAHKEWREPWMKPEEIRQHLEMITSFSADGTAIQRTSWNPRKAIRSRSSAKARP